MIEFGSVAIYEFATNMNENIIYIVSSKAGVVQNIIEAKLQHVRVGSRSIFKLDFPGLIMLLLK